jgi:hypothetical protein
LLLLGKEQEEQIKVPQMGSGRRTADGSWGRLRLEVEQLQAQLKPLLHTKNIKVFY